MNVLIVAPKLCTPWSEGRKKFVCDLLNASRDQWRVSLLTTYDGSESAADFPGLKQLALPARYSFQHLTQLHKNLGHAIASFQPDLVCYFPFGAFAGIRSLANILFIREFERICGRRQVKQMTLMYSLTLEAKSWWDSGALKNVYRNQYSGHHRSIRFGVQLPEVPERLPLAHTPTRLLFMAGMAECRSERLDYAVNVRGLGLLLECGQALREKGFTLTVAMPLLRDTRLLETLKSKSTAWAEAISFQAIADTPTIYQEHDLFVFPYAREEMQFVPTSVVEAMHCGLPVVLPRLNFLRPFHHSESLVKAYDVGDPATFLRALTQLQHSKEEYDTLAIRGKQFIDDEYNIDVSVADIESTWRELSRA